MAMIDLNKYGEDMLVGDLFDMCRFKGTRYNALSKFDEDDVPLGSTWSLTYQSSAYHIRMYLMRKTCIGSLWGPWSKNHNSGNFTVINKKRETSPNTFLVTLHKALNRRLVIQ